MKRKIFHAMTPLGVMEEFIEKQAKNGYRLISIQKTMLDISYCMKFTSTEKNRVVCHLQETENGLSWEYGDPDETVAEPKNNIDKGLLLFLKINTIASGVILMLWFLLCIAVGMKATQFFLRIGMIFIISFAIFYLVLKAMRTPLMVTKKSKNKENLLVALVMSIATTTVFEIVCQILSFI